MLSDEEYMKQRLALEKQQLEIMRLNTFVSLFNVVFPSMSEKDRAFWREFLKGKMVELMSDNFPKSMTKRFRSMEI